MADDVDREMDDPATPTPSETPSDAPPSTSTTVTATESGAETPAESDELATIRVKALNEQQAELRVDLNTPLLSLREMIQESLGIPTGRQRIIFRGKACTNDSSTLAQLGIINGQTIHVVDRPEHIRRPEGTSNDSRGSSQSSRTPSGGQRQFVPLHSFSSMSQAQQAFNNFVNLMPTVNNTSVQQSSITDDTAQQPQPERAPARVRWTLNVQENTFTRDRDRFTEIVNNVINGLSYLTREDIGRFRVSWVNEGLRIDLPTMATHIASPAYERLNFVEMNVYHMINFRNVISEENGLLAMVRGLHDFSTHRLSSDDEAERTRLMQLVRDIATRLEQSQGTAASAAAASLRRLRQSSDAQRAARLQRVSEPLLNPEFVVRHAITEDMDDVLRQMRKEQAAFVELENLVDELITPQLIEHINETNVVNDYRLYALVTLQEHMTRRRHCLAHMTHTSTEIEYHLFGQRPQRLQPQYDLNQLVVPYPHQGTIIIALHEEPQPSNVAPVTASAIFAPPRRTSDVLPSRPGEWPHLTFYPMGIMQEQHELAVPLMTVSMQGPTAVAMPMQPDGTIGNTGLRPREYYESRFGAVPPNPPQPQQQQQQSATQPSASSRQTQAPPSGVQTQTSTFGPPSSHLQMVYGAIPQPHRSSRIIQNRQQPPAQSQHVGPTPNSVPAPPVARQTQTHATDTPRPTPPTTQHRQGFVAVQPSTQWVERMPPPAEGSLPSHIPRTYRALHANMMRERRREREDERVLLQDLNNIQDLLRDPTTEINHLYELALGRIPPMEGQPTPPTRNRSRSQELHPNALASVPTPTSAPVPTPRSEVTVPTPSSRLPSGSVPHILSMRRRARSIPPNEYLTQGTIRHQQQPTAFQYRNILGPNTRTIASQPESMDMSDIQRVAAIVGSRFRESALREVARRLRSALSAQDPPWMIPLDLAATATLRQLMILSLELLTSQAVTLREAGELMTRLVSNVDLFVECVAASLRQIFVDGTWPPLMPLSAFADRLTAQAPSRAPTGGDDTTSATAAGSASAGAGPSSSTQGSPPDDDPRAALAERISTAMGTAQQEGMVAEFVVQQDIQDMQVSDNENSNSGGEEARVELGFFAMAPDMTDANMHEIERVVNDELRRVVNDVNVHEIRRVENDFMVPDEAQEVTIAMEVYAGPASDSMGGLSVDETAELERAMQRERDDIAAAQQQQQQALNVGRIVASLSDSVSNAFTGGLTAMLAQSRGRMQQTTPPQAVLDAAARLGLGSDFSAPLSGQPTTSGGAQQQAETIRPPRIARDSFTVFQPTFREVPASEFMQLAESSAPVVRRQTISIDPFLHCSNRHSEMVRVNGTEHPEEPRALTNDSFAPNPEYTELLTDVVFNNQRETETVANDPEFTYQINRQQTGPLVFTNGDAGVQEFERVLRTGLRSLFGQLLETDAMIVLNSSRDDDSLNPHQRPWERFASSAYLHGRDTNPLRPTRRPPRSAQRHRMGASNLSSLLQMDRMGMRGPNRLRSMSPVLRDVHAFITDSPNLFPRSMVGGLFDVMRSRISVTELARILQNPQRRQLILHDLYTSFREHVTANYIGAEGHPTPTQLQRAAEEISGSVQHFTLGLARSTLPSTMIVNGRPYNVARTMRNIEVLATRQMLDGLYDYPPTRTNTSEPMEQEGMEGEPAAARFSFVLTAALRSYMQNMVAVAYYLGGQQNSEIVNVIQRALMGFVALATEQPVPISSSPDRQRYLHVANYFSTFFSRRGLLSLRELLVAFQAPSGETIASTTIVTQVSTAEAEGAVPPAMQQHQQQQYLQQQTPSPTTSGTADGASDDGESQPKRMKRESPQGAGNKDEEGTGPNEFAREDMQMLSEELRTRLNVFDEETRRVLLRDAQRIALGHPGRPVERNNSDAEQIGLPTEFRRHTNSLDVAHLVSEAMLANGDEFAPSEEHMSRLPVEATRAAHAMFEVAVRERLAVDADFAASPPGRYPNVDELKDPSSCSPPVSACVSTSSTSTSSASTTRKSSSNKSRAARVIATSREDQPIMRGGRVDGVPYRVDRTRLLLVRALVPATVALVGVLWYYWCRATGVKYG